MTKADLINLVAEKTEMKKVEAEKAVNAVFEGITETLAKGEEVRLVGFGAFEVRERSAKMGINPSTKEKISIPAKKVPAFKAGKALKEAVDK